MSKPSVYQFSARQILLLTFASAFIAAGTVACLNNFGKSFISASETGEVSLAEPPAGISNPDTVSDEKNNIEVYKTLSPGVAFITASSVSYVQDWFGDVQAQEGQGSGSGSVIDAQGHILTNYHVVEGAQKLSVSFGGEKSYPAKVVGTDPDTDLAVIQIVTPPEGLTVVPFGDSTNLTVGQKVLAIGNPFGLDRTLTTGVISGLQRPIRSRPTQSAPQGRVIEGAIQTDASINPGNSGGPLLDKYGRMIGINSQILSPAGGSVGVGFAIPVSIAKRIVPQLLQFGEVKRPKLGVNTRDVGALVNNGAKLPIDNGLLVMNVQPGGPADKAGIKGLSQNANRDVLLGDIITALDGEKLKNQDDLFRLLDKKQIGDTVQLEIYRDGKTISLPVRLQDIPAQQPTRSGPRRF
jgi:S1-C subfamily serine protease